MPHATPSSVTEPSRQSEIRKEFVAHRSTPGDPEIFADPLTRVAGDLQRAPAFSEPGSRYFSNQAKMCATLEMR